MNMCRLADSFLRERVRVLITAVVVEDAACDDAEMLGEIQRGGDDE